MEQESQKFKIQITENGPYEVSGNLPIHKGIMMPDENGIPQYVKQGEELPAEEVYYLCRCGQSGHKPFCDDTHLIRPFNGTETAENKPYSELSTRIMGPDLEYDDAKVYCASARFCMRAGGIRHLVQNPDGPESQKIAMEEAFVCPSGKLVAIDKQTGEILEPRLKPGIVISEDPGRNVSGPIWVQGGVEVVSAEGKSYEVRNRVALCRCGHSGNKPFCDGSHIRYGFRDGDASLEG